MLKPPYDDSIKATALAILDTAGYPVKRGALKAVSHVTGIPASTLRRWAHDCRAGRSPLAHPTGAGPLSAAHPVTTAPLKDVVQNELLAIVRSMAAARSEASYKELSAGFAALAGKLKALDTGPEGPSEGGSGEAKERLAMLVGMGQGDRKAQV
jgi:hypothetical protein